MANARHENNLAATSDRCHGYRSDTQLDPAMEEARRLAAERRKSDAAHRRKTLAAENSRHFQTLASTGVRSDMKLSKEVTERRKSLAMAPDEDMIRAFHERRELESCADSTMY